MRIPLQTARMQAQHWFFILWFVLRGIIEAGICVPKRDTKKCCKMMRIMRKPTELIDQIPAYLLRNFRNP